MTAALSTGMRYDSYRFLYPPRPERAIPAGMIPMYEDRGWWWQIKMNGTCTGVCARGDEVIYKKRDGSDHRNWRPNAHHDAFFRASSQDSSEWSVWVAELLHSKTPTIKDRLYVHDIIVEGGRYLTDMTFKRRQEILEEWIPATERPDNEFWHSHEAMPQYVCRARNFVGYAGWFMDKANEGVPGVEGVVLKNPNATLALPFTESANSGWQVKCRVSHKNYGF